MYLIIVGFGFIFMIRDSTRGVSGISSIWRCGVPPTGMPTSCGDVAQRSGPLFQQYALALYSERLYAKYHEQLNGEYYPVDKLISELTPDDMTLLPRGGFYFRFVTRRRSPGKHTLFVRLTADDGKVIRGELRRGLSISVSLLSGTDFSVGFLVRHFAARQVKFSEIGGTLSEGRAKKY